MEQSYKPKNHQDDHKLLKNKVSTQQTYRNVNTNTTTGKLA